MSFRSKECLVKGKLSSLGFCENCILSKASKLKFEDAVHTTKDKLG